MGASCINLNGQDGVNFAVYSRHAQRIDVCFYDASNTVETGRIALPVCTDGVWHGFVPGMGVGQLYGLRAHGPYQPQHGHRFNPAKLLIDPFARDLAGDTRHLSLERDYLGQPADHATVLDALPDPTDNAARIPKARVLNWDVEFQAGSAITPCLQTPLAQTVLYEVHVKGLTQRHPDIPAALQGSYAGLVSAPMLAHYKRLGITTLCLLPVHLHVTEAHLLKKGLRNYWGYNTLGFFVPEPAYASGQYPDTRTEFRHMVDQLHRDGLEVVLDVVYNHSAESDTFGPTLSWRGLDNASWYSLDDKGQYLNFSGCGNSLNTGQPCTIQLVMDSLRWWVKAFGVDGFRFDLATALGRDPVLQHHFHPLSGLLAAMGQDPVLRQVKCIAEPWDIGLDGYKLGQFPAGWHEWNDRFRDTSRSFWLGFDCTRGDFARRLTASSDLFNHGGRNPMATINLITAHDGMTLADLTSYCHNHNLANGENNRDGHNHNLSANAGVEGPSQDMSVQSIRGQWRRALLASLFCSQGTPQLLAGDEFGNSQAGNNNAYCQDNETSWLDWIGRDRNLADFVAALIHLRHDHAALRHAYWFTGTRLNWSDSSDIEAGNSDSDVDISWRNPDGTNLSSVDWEDRHCRSFACLIAVADTGLKPAERWLLVFHASSDVITVALPPGPWVHVLDSSAAMVLPQARWATAKTYAGAMSVSPRSIFGLVQTLDAPETLTKLHNS